MAESRLVDEWLQKAEEDPVHWPTRYSKEEALKAHTACKHVRDAIREALAVTTST